MNETQIYELQYLDPIQIKPECIRFNKYIHELKSSNDTSCQNSQIGKKILKIKNIW